MVRIIVNQQPNKIERFVLSESKMFRYHYCNKWLQISVPTETLNLKVCGFSQVEELERLVADERKKFQVVAEKLQSSSLKLTGCTREAGQLGCENSRAAKGEVCVVHSSPGSLLPILENFKPWSNVLLGASNHLN